MQINLPLNNTECLINVASYVIHNSDERCMLKKLCLLDCSNSFYVKTQKLLEKSNKYNLFDIINVVITTPTLL